jgi:pyruvate-formate lyase-activating enzyme
MIDIETYNETPNFSVIVPQACNMHCEFCSNNGVSEGGNKDWMECLKQVIWSLPAKFRSVSITGGEPTLYAGIDGLMFYLRKRFERVVVSTNGAKLGAMGFVLKHANDVNLSWHGWDTESVSAMFGRRVEQPDKNAIVFLREAGTGVTLNWVILKGMGFDGEDVSKYVKLAESLGCSAVAFRYDMRESDGLDGDWIPELPSSFGHIGDTGCPVCHTWKVDRRGFPVFFKASVMEPKEVLDTAYELIYTADGVLSTTWDGAHPVGNEGDDMTNRDSERLDRIERLVERMANMLVVNDAPEKPRRTVVHRCEEDGGGSCRGGGGGHC